ncbi:hypothetical protein E4U31_002135 [Claviceps sp. LM219 group G6]|nr:hypothetical protein E4U31_002135 [Claviceps sp. LM219 group G6]KAG6121460.1 hypothetical protein E4U14_001846 [Claviceps sp. LM454 group G7]
MAISLICEVLHGRCFPKSNAVSPLSHCDMMPGPQSHARRARLSADLGFPAFFPSSVNKANLSDGYLRVNQ